MFQDQVIWITGASSGIGEALAIAFAKQGAKLILSARRKNELERVKSACGLPTDQVLVLPLDLLEQAKMPEKASFALQQFGHIDILINNGGISQRSLAVNTSLDVDRRILEVDYLGTVALTKALLPHFIARQKGKVVVISSLVGKFGTPYRSSYSAAKHALHGFFDSLRAELDEHSIDIQIICPGFIHTEVSKNALTGDGTPLQKMDKATSSGMPPERFAKKAIQAIYRGTPETYIGGKERIGVYVKRFFPAIFRRMIVRAKVR